MTSVRMTEQKKVVTTSTPTDLPADTITGDEGKELPVGEAIFVAEVEQALLGRSCVLVVEAKDTQNNSALLQLRVLQLSQNESLLAIDVNK